METQGKKLGGGLDFLVSIYEEYQFYAFKIVLTVTYLKNAVRLILIL